ncbi:RDD family protein [Allosalinactinospora lopnorensis]|uniref:RDD family protein n=1 Tax=Allosalinactinospora lopnorensis TaxID=1352348 RepID=UPI00069684EA|nr:RDD family protein [Allosalinactinospora lopnorensis]
MNDARGPHPAGPGRRVPARLIDLLVIGAIGALISTVVVRTVPGGEDPMRLEFPAGFVLSLVVFLAYVGYEVVLTSLYGATPGKLLCGVRTISADGAARPDVDAVAKRSAVLYLSVLFNWVPLLGLLALGVSVYAVVSAFLDRPRRRGLHDRVGGTAVVTSSPHSVSS